MGLGGFLMFLGKGLDDVAQLALQILDFLVVLAMFLFTLLLGSLPKMFQAVARLLVFVFQRLAVLLFPGQAFPQIGDLLR